MMSQSHPPPFLRSLTGSEKRIVFPSILQLPAWLAEELADRIEYYRQSIGSALLVRNLLDAARRFAKDEQNDPQESAVRERASRTLDAVARQFQEDFGAADDQ